MSWRWLLALVAVAGLFVSGVPVGAAAVPDHPGQATVVRILTGGSTALVSVSATGVTTDLGVERWTSISADGTKVAFMSRSRNLHPDDTDALADVFVKDLVSGLVILVSRRGIAGAKSNGYSALASLSADGSKVAFTSQATNLHPGDTDSLSDLFVKDVETGAVTLVSRVGKGGAKANGSSRGASLSADGTKVAFSSVATNLHPDDTDALEDVLFKDLVTGTIEVASLSPTGVKANERSDSPSLSADGSRVAFGSVATNLHPDDTDDRSDVYVKDLTTGSLTLVSRASGNGAKGNESSFEAVISGNGDYVAFTSYARLHPADTWFSLDVYRRNLSTGAVTLVSRVGLNGVVSNYHSYGPSISADGTKVAFLTEATNLHPLTRNLSSDLDVMVKDLVTGHILLASTSSAGVRANTSSYGVALAAGGSRVAFVSAASNLHPKAGGGLNQVFAKRTPLCKGRLATIVGTAGKDVIRGTKGRDVIWAGRGNDVVYGLGGNDVICGGPGNDALYGGLGDDVLRGGSGKDALNGGAGHDKLWGDAGADKLRGGAGTDVLHGGAGNDELRGGGGKDTLNGGGGHDKLWGGAGNDTLNAGNGKDMLNGGEGRDVCNGGAGIDTATGCETRTGIP